MCLFSEIDRVLCFMRKRTRGQGIRGRVRGESHQRRYNLVILRMFEIQAPDYWTFILLAGLVTRPPPPPSSISNPTVSLFSPRGYSRDLTHTWLPELSAFAILYFSAYSVTFSWVSFHFWPTLWIMLSLIPSITGQVLLTESLTNKQNPFNPDLLLFFLGTDVFGMPLNKLPNKTNKAMGLRRVSSMWRIDPELGAEWGLRPPRRNKNIDNDPGTIWTAALLSSAEVMRCRNKKTRRTINCKIINTRQNVVN